MAWLWLVIGGLFEVGFTTSLRHVEGFTNFKWTAIFVISVGISMALLELGARQIPMGTAYAVWGGIGTIGTVIVSIWLYGEPLNALRIALILGIVGSAIGLKATA
jgi:quaternary ammonium compound-resistance protein SugE